MTDEELKLAWEVIEDVDRRIDARNYEAFIPRASHLTIVATDLWHEVRRLRALCEEINWADLWLHRELPDGEYTVGAWQQHPLRDQCH